MEIDELHDSVKTFQEKALDGLAGLKSRLEDVEVKLDKPGANHGERENPEKKAFKNWLATGEESYTDGEKAINIAIPGDGGVAVPEQIGQSVNAQVKQISPIRQIARVVQVSTSDYKEVVDVHGTTSGWVGETTVPTETDTPTLEEVAPTMGELYAEPRATQWSLEDIFFDVEAWLNNSVSIEFAKQEGVAFISGNGTNRPTGFLNGTPVLTADDSRAFGTLQYIASGAAAALDNPDVLLNLVYALKSEYRQNATWVMNSATANTIRQLKDADGNYLWIRGLEGGQPDRLLGYPVVEAADMPAIGADAYPIAFGDFNRGYLIVDRTPITMIRDPFTAKPYVKFYTRKRVGGKILDSNAIKLLKIEA